MGEAAARFGSVRVAAADEADAPARAAIRSDDEQLVRTLAVDQSLVVARAAAVGPAPAARRGSPPTWCSGRSSDARYPVAAEDGDGEIVRLRRHRLAPAPPPPPKTDPIAALLDRVLATGDEGATEQAWLARQLEAAATGEGDAHRHGAHARRPDRRLPARAGERRERPAARPRPQGRHRAHAAAVGDRGGLARAHERLSHAATRMPRARPCAHEAGVDSNAMSDGPLIVQSDRTVLLEVAHPLAEDARHDLAVFAELERAPEHVHTYRITRLGLWNARAAGHDAEDMLAHARAVREVPRAADGRRSTSRETVGRYGRLVIDRTDDGALRLHSRRHRRARPRSRSAKRIAPLLIERTRRRELPRRGRGRAAQLKQELLKLGWPAEDLAGYTPGTPHPIDLDQTELAPARLPAEGRRQLLRGRLGRRRAALRRGQDARRRRRDGRRRRRRRSSS